MNSKVMNKGMMAMMFASLMLIFGGYLAVYPTLANASDGKALGKAAGSDAVGKVEKVEKAPKAKELDDAELLKLAADMNLMEKNLEKVMKNEVNRVKFFDPNVNKGLIDRDLLGKLPLLEQGILDDFDKFKPDSVNKDDEENEPQELEEVEPVEVEELEDAELLKIAMDMNVMAKEMEDFLKNDSSWERFFNPVVTKGLIDRPLLLDLLLLQLGLLDAFDAPFLGAEPFEDPFEEEKPFFGERQFFGEREEFDD